VTFRNRETGLVLGSVTTYVFADSVDDINPDPNWGENFAIGDVPTGRWDVIVEIDGQRVVRQVQVLEGTTSFVELRASAPASEETEESNGG
jgi:hypothetical protein